MDEIVFPLRVMERLDAEQHECSIGYEGYYVEPAFLVVHRSKGEKKVLDVFRDAGRAEEECRRLAACRSAARSALHELK